MHLWVIPMMFSLLTLTLCTFMLKASQRHTREWVFADYIYTALLGFSGIAPTWCIYFVPQFYVPLMWTMLAVLFARVEFEHAVDGSFSKAFNRTWRFGLAAVVISMSWVTWIIITCETNWRHVAH